MATRTALDDDFRGRQLDQGEPYPTFGVEWPELTSRGAMQQWLFDSPTAAPRLLRQRSGHHAPPHLIRYYGDDGKSILSAGADRALRYTSVVRDSRGYELSQGMFSCPLIGRVPRADSTL